MIAWIKRHWPWRKRQPPLRIDQIVDKAAPVLWEKLRHMPVGRIKLPDRFEPRA